MGRVGVGGIKHWESPTFYAYFPANASGPAIRGDLLSSGLGVQGMLWSTSPACTELETHVLDWLVPMLGLPEKFLSSGSGGWGNSGNIWNCSLGWGSGVPARGTPLVF